MVLQMQVSEPLPEVNIAVIGAGGVGKSTFVQKALDLPTLSPSQAAERKIPIDGNVYLVRLLELPIDDVDIDEDDIVTWPDTIADKVMPRVDGAIALYNVQDKDTFDDIPEVLSECCCLLAPAKKHLLRIYHPALLNGLTDPLGPDRCDPQSLPSYCVDLVQVRRRTTTRSSND